jgi:3-phosphoshikimate 1-carboxyvinyltransferase
LSNKREIGGELLADIRVQSSQLKGIHIPVELVPLAIDEFPAIFIAASCAQGETVLTGAKELRVKESDRIQVMADGLDMLGIENEVLEEGIKIQGGTY